MWSGSELFARYGCVSTRMTNPLKSGKSSSTGTSGMSSIDASARFSDRPIMPPKPMTAVFFSLCLMRVQNAAALARESGSGLSCGRIRILLFFAVGRTASNSATLPAEFFDGGSVSIHSSFSVPRTKKHIGKDLQEQFPRAAQQRES
jgi:hypothetical protein